MAERGHASPRISVETFYFCLSSSSSDSNRSEFSAITTLNSPSNAANVDNISWTSENGCNEFLNYHLFTIWHEMNDTCCRTRIVRQKIIFTVRSSCGWTSAGFSSTFSELSENKEMKSRIAFMAGLFHFVRFFIESFKLQN